MHFRNPEDVINGIALEGVLLLFGAREANPNCESTSH